MNNHLPIRQRGARAVSISLSLLLVAGMFAGGCKLFRRRTAGLQLAVGVTVADSVADIERMIRASLADKYSLTNVAQGYSMHRFTNGPASWVFVLAANAPRGLDVYSLYCYEQHSQAEWVLRGYVPLWGSFYTNGFGRGLSIQPDGKYVNVVFRGKTAFTWASSVTAADKPLSSGTP